MTPYGWSTFYLILVIATIIFCVASREVSFEKMSWTLFLQWTVASVGFPFNPHPIGYLIVDVVLLLYVFYDCKVRILNTHVYFAILSTMMVLTHLLKTFSELSNYRYELSLNLFFLSQCLLLLYHCFKIRYMGREYYGQKSRRRHVFSVKTSRK